MGAGLGKTTGWIHRSELKQRGVTMVPGVADERIDDDGLHDELTARGVSVHLIVAAELDAKRAIDQGTQLAGAV